MSLLRRVRPEKTGVRAPLGELEMAIMRCIWPCGVEGCFAAVLQKTLGEARPVALTTVLTTLDRLYDKGILLREREGKAYRYRAALSEEELQQRIVSGVLGELIAQFPHAVASYFAQQDASPDAQGADDERARLAALAERLARIRAAQTADTRDTSAGDTSAGGEGD